MDKKKELSFNLNNFLLALSLPIDYLRKDKCSTSINYSKRVAYLSLNIGRQLNLTPQEMSDLCSYSLLHSIGLFNCSNLSKEYCESSNDISKSFPFLLENKNILKYQSEYFDGSGLYGLKGDKTPLFSQILSFAIALENRFNLSSINTKERTELINFVKSSENELFSKKITDIFLEISQKCSFWLDLQNENEILYFIFGNLYDFTLTLKFEEVLKICSDLYFINNSDSHLLSYVEQMSDFYKFEHKDKFTLLIAASLCKIGKICISSSIIDKNSALDEFEYEEIKAYPYYTNKVLSNIIGFSDINSWAIKVQERVDKSGYPYSLAAKDLSLKDRLLAILVIYDSLRINKVYRKAYSHQESLDILKDLAKQGKIDISIVEDISVAITPNK
ncbi:MAG: phosphohydrolase [Arcobacter sp.]|mgnify:CR=1 FL=1|uniref:HD-GYP domain-containing protein n=1 Tax=uncultured Arcobacter sp. TaxID=165434 RepID=UPI000CBFABDD|nr:HD domain-containing phosphohydrolase [uncultured Arcobacter sp.]PLY11346.1 MAG: phosphohydrolase [Arcobacter sp.]